MKQLLFIIICFAIIPYSYSQWFINHSGDKNLGVIKFINDSVGFAMGQDGLILKSEDVGETWSIVDIDTEIDIYDFQFVNDSIILIAGGIDDPWGYCEIIISYDLA